MENCARRSVRALAQTLLVLMALNGGAQTAGLPPSCSIAPEPAWVDPVSDVFEAVPEGREAISDGVQHLVVDNQVCLGATNASYYHYAFRFLTEAGVRESSSIQVECDPSYQSVQFHRLRLWRGAQVIDCLDAKVFRTLQRETSLEWKLLDGRLTLLAVIEDVRVGDVLEYAYTVIGDNPIFEGNYGGSFLLGWTVPVLHQRLRVRVPTPRMLYRRMTGATAPEPVESRAPDAREWLWDQTSATPLQVESSLPIWYKPLPEVVFSEYASWADVARWAAAHYTTTGGVEVLTPRIDAWRQLPSAEDRAVAALEFVQDEIRYFGLELGAGSHRPNPPALVLQRRFGDCKDKAVLLCTILAALGIEARPALVNVFLRQRTADELPSPFAFNHVIVVADVDGTPVWMDPTRVDQRGRLRDRYLPPYGTALVIAETTTALQPVEAGEAEQSRTETNERFDLSNPEGPARLTVRSQFWGRDAENSRARVSNTARADLERHYLNYYAQRYAGVKQDGEVSVDDATASKGVTITERYTIHDIWSPDRDATNRQSVTFTAQELQVYVEQPTTVLRTMPMGLPYPVDAVQVIEILMPDDWNVEPERSVISDPYLHFEFSAVYTNRLITLTYRLRTLADAVPVADMVTHLDIRRQIARSLDYAVTSGANGEPAAVEPAFSFNWPLAGGCALWCALLLAAGVRCYRHRSPPPVLSDISLEKPDASPHGIGGWLILPCIGLFVGVFTILRSLAQLNVCFDATVWQALTTPGSPDYHPYWLPTFLLELLGNSFMFALLVLNGVLLIRRRTSFPRFMIVLYMAQVVLIVADTVLSQRIPVVAEQGSTPQEVPRAILAACIWIPYFLTSRRVRNTFRK